MQLSEIKIGQPLIFKSAIYGDMAVHVAAIYNEVVHLTIDGGEAAKQVRNFPELSDGKYFALAGRLEKRSSKRLGRTTMNSPRKVTETGRTLESFPPAIKNTVRTVPGVGKVALIEAGPIAGTRFVNTPPELQRHIEKAAAAKPSAPERKRRMSLNAALNRAREMADRNPTRFKWAKPGEVETF